MDPDALMVIPRSARLRRLAAFLWLLLASAFAPESGAAQSLEGILFERGSDRPIDLAVVTLMDLEGDSVVSVLTDDLGRFSLEPERAGDYYLAASAWGYETTVAGSVFTLAPAGSISVEFRISRAPLELPGLMVEAENMLKEHPLEMNGFVERARMGFGRFITPSQIEESRAYGTADLLTRTGRVMLEHVAGGDRIKMLGFGGYCDPFVYLDGRRIYLDGLSIDTFVPMRDLEGVEVYRSAIEAPPQYAVNVWRCGVILLWTKRR